MYKSVGHRPQKCRHWLVANRQVAKTAKIFHAS
jgi:hypothetical protein